MADYLTRNPLIYPVEPALPPGTAGNFMVIPVYDENDHIYETLRSVKQALERSPEAVKIILVLNEPPHAGAGSRLANR